MSKSNLKPALRPVETIVLPDPEHGRVVVLRDTAGVTEAYASIPPALVPIVARFGGELTVAQIAREASRDLAVEVPEELVERLARELDKALFLEGPTFEQARARVAREFADAAVRPASHAGGAYASDARELASYVEKSCLAKANGVANGGAAKAKGRRAVGLIAPHIDPWRGAVGYGHAYGTLARTLPAEADTFVLFGTSHAPMREAFALCRKAFDTPLGAIEADLEAVDRIAARCNFDPYADLLNHKREHSLEFQVVFLKHMLGSRPARIIPVLAGLGAQQASRSNPERDRHASEFLDAVRELLAERSGRVVVVAGADLAHVGPRFGDPRPFNAAERQALEESDRGSLARAEAGDAGAFWEDVARDLDARRICGLAPIYSLLRTIPEAAKGEVLHYEQTVDAGDGSIVSHAAVAFYE